MQPPRTIADLAARTLERSAQRRVILSAVGDPSRERTASRLLGDAEALARSLSRAGIEAGGLVMLEGIAEARFVTACLAAWSLDASVLPADPSTPPRELSALRAAFGPGWRLFAGDGRGGVAAQRLGVPGAGASPAACRGPQTPPAGTAIIKLTSGSTGAPRGVAVSAGQLMADGRHIIDGMGIRPDDTNVAAIPLSHSYGQGNLLMPLLMQGTAMLLADPRHPESFVRALSGEAPMVFPGVPALFGMLGHPDVPAPAPRGLRLCLSAGALLTSATARAFRARTGLPVRAFYGTSETGGICFDGSAGGDAAETLEGAVGPPLPGVEVSIDPETARVVVGGDSVAMGYVGPVTDMDEANARAGRPGGLESGGRMSWQQERSKEVGGTAGRFASGRFHTGDTGIWIDGSESPRSLRLTGRLGDVVNVAGRKVDPAEVERVLRALDGVREAVVIGVADPVRGEALAACLEADASVTRERVLERLRAELAPHKVPRRIVFMDRLPRNERGKTDKEALKRALHDRSEIDG